MGLLLISMSTILASVIIISSVFGLKLPEVNVLEPIEEIYHSFWRTDCSLNNDSVGDLFFLDLNKYVLYTSKNPENGQTLILGDADSVKKSYFDPAKKTLITVHGWLLDFRIQISSNVTRAVLDSIDGENWNVIKVFWEIKSQSNFGVSSAASRSVAKDLAGFLDWMSTQGLVCDRTILQGQSLGAQVAAMAARASECKVNRVILTDAARPCWDNNPDRAKKSDAKLVIAIHSSDDMGMYAPMGHADFYANDGIVTKNCNGDALCQHLMAVRYWMATWTNPEMFTSRLCSSILEVSENSCSGPEALFGGYNMTNTPEGIYRFNTNPEDFPHIAAYSLATITG